MSHTAHAQRSGATIQDVSRYKKIGETTNTEIYIAESDPDILIIIPRQGTKDNGNDACENVEYYHDYARSLGRPCGSLVVMSNMLSQDAEARRAYATLDPTLIYGGALVVGNALSRALGSFFVGLNRPRVPTRLFDTIEHGLQWLKTMRPT